MNTSHDSSPDDDRLGRLFDPGPVEAPIEQPAAEGSPRLRRAQRDQRQAHYLTLDELLPDDHTARIVWAFVQGLDLKAFYRRIRAVEGHRGRAAVDPRILLALWLYATLEGVSSARALDRLCTEHLAFQWLAGGVPMNWSLSQFRVRGLAKVRMVALWYALAHNRMRAIALQQAEKDEN